MYGKLMIFIFICDALFPLYFNGLDNSMIAVFFVEMFILIDFFSIDENSNIKESQRLWPILVTNCTYRLY